MRITFVLPFAGLAGGIRVVAKHAENLQRRGHSVFVASLPKRRRGSRWQPLRRMLRPADRNCSPSEPSYFEGLDVAHVVVDHEAPITDADVPDADVVVATWWETADWVAALSTDKGAKAYLIQHHEIHPGQPAARVNATWGLPLHKIVVSRWLAGIAHDMFGDSDVSLVPNAVEHNLFDAPPRGKQATPTVGFMYSDKRFKRCEFAIEAIRLVRQRLPALRVVAFGAHDVVPRLPLPPDCSLSVQPPQEQLREIYAACDAWLFSSDREGFGLPILEAMACRTPVIATPAGAAPDLIADEGGILVDPNDPRGMAAAITRLAETSNESWCTMSNLAYDAARRYSWEDATDLFEAALLRAIAKGRPDRARIGALSDG